MNLKKENFLANLKAAKETTKEIKAVYKEIKQIIAKPVFIPPPPAELLAIIEEEMFYQLESKSEPVSSNHSKEEDKSGLNAVQKNSFEVSISEDQMLKELNALSFSQPTRKPAQFGSFYVLGELGKGSSGCTYLCIDKKTHFLFAIKQMKISNILDQKKEQQVQREIDLHRQLSHPAIVDLFSVTFDDQNVFLVMESLLKKEEKYESERQVSITVGQITDALSYLHSKKLIYRDLKPENIVLKFFGFAKLVDFGLMIKSTEKRPSIAGTLEFIAPEVLKFMDFDSQSDMWSLGVLSYELLVGKSPFNIQSFPQAFERAHQPQCSLCFPSNLSKQAISWITGLLQKDPSVRMTSQMALKHPFLHEYREWRKN